MAQRVAVARIPCIPLISHFQESTAVLKLRIYKIINFKTAGLNIIQIKAVHLRAFKRDNH